MLAILAFFVACIVIAEVFEKLPEILSDLGNLLCFLARCVCLTVLLLGKGLWVVAVYAGKAIAVASIDAWLFATVLFDEWRRGAAPADDTGAEAAQQPAEPEAPEDPYTAALRRLGLSEPFTLPDLKRVYRQAMKAAHTDMGGRKEDAQALNFARDFVMQVKGWR